MTIDLEPPSAGPPAAPAAAPLAPGAPLPEPGAPSAPTSISFEDRMATVEFRVAAEAHITVDSDVCRSCTTKACVSACPANLFVPTSDGGVLFNYEQCFECGTCYLVCNHEGAISWSYPLGGFGVVMRHA
jgi:ferredoxin like protein